MLAEQGLRPQAYKYNTGILLTCNKLFYFLVSNYNEMMEKEIFNGKLVKLTIEPK
jgi:hypothetical protein